MAIGFNIQFRINEKTQSRVIRLTDTSNGFTLSKGNFSIVFPDGTAINHTDFLSPDISAGGLFYEFQAPTDIYNNVLTGTYSVTFVAIDNASTTYNLNHSFDFNWIKPTNGITNLSDVLIPEVKFQDVTSYSPIGSFTGTLTRTLSASFPTTSEASAVSPISTVSENIINVISSGKYYDGTYTPTSDVSVIYTHSTNSWLSVYYTELFTKTYLIKRCPTQLELVIKINNYRALIDAYKEKNDTQFNTLSEQYDLVIALYTHLITRYETSTQDGSEPVLRELLSILEPYATSYTPQLTRMLPFQIASTGTNSFSISDGTNTDSVPLGSTLLLSSGNPAFTIGVSDNMVTYTPIFGTTSNTFAQGNDSRLHNAVTLGTANGLSLASQVLSLALATVSTSGAISAADKAKLDGIAAGANTGTVTSIAISVPSAFSVSNSPITTSGTINISATGSPSQYITGAGALATFLTDVRAGISLTTTGTSGAATYNSTTGVLNIPQYQGGVTSFNTRTGAVTLTSGDVTTALTYTPQQPITLTTTGTSGAATFVGNTLNIPQYQGGVTSFNTRTGAITLTSGDVTTALGFTPQGVLTLTTTGTSGAATLVGNTLNIPQYSGGGSGTLRSVQNFTATAGQTTFTISGGYTVGQLDVFLNGVRLTGSDYTASDGTTVVLAAGALVGDIVDVLSYAGLTGYVASSSFSATTPLIYSAGNYSIQVANTSQSGYLTSTDWNTFNNKQAALGFTPYNSTNPSNYIALTALSSTATGLTYTNTTGVFSLTSGYVIPTTTSATNWDTAYTNRITSLTTTGSSGAATLSANTLNIPTYTLSGLGGQALSTNLTSLSGLTFASTAFVKMTASGTFALDTTVYTSNLGTVTSVAALTLGTTGTDVSSTVATSTTTPVITLNIPTASATNRGALSSSDWSTFNSKQGALTLTTTGTSGAATLVGNTLNIPNYATGGGGSVAGANTQIQFNNAGAFGASAGLTWDGTSITATNQIATGGSASYGAFTPTFTDGIVSDYVSGYGRISVGGGDGIQFYNGGVGGSLLGQVTSGGDWDFNGNLIIGTGTAITGAVNPILAIAASSTGYVQAYIHNDNAGASSSSDIACYPDNGIDTSGWIDMGITSSTYSDASYTTTGANEGYIFMSAPSGASKSGNLVFATDSTGTQNYFQWYVGGFGQAKSAYKMQLKGTALDLSIPLNSTVTTGTAPFTVASTTQVANLFATKAATVSDGSIGIASLSATGTPSATTYLRGDNTWATTGTVTSVAALTLGTTGTDLTSSVATGTSTPVITLNVPTASATNRGVLSSADWSTFNGKQGALTLTTTGTSGAATLVGNTLNIPNYAGGGGSFSGTLAAGTATTAPLDFTTAGSVLKTTPVAGDFETDTAGIFYYTHATSSRGVVHSEQFISLSGTYTLTSQTAAQKMFNTTTNGAVTVQAATTYYFECFYSLTAMSATSGSFGFAIGGTATLTSLNWTSMAVKATTGTTAATLQTTFNTTAANTTIVTASTQTGGSARITGTIRVNASGTIIPQVSLGQAAAAVVGVNSYFRIIPIGTNTVTSVGNWS